VNYLNSVPRNPAFFRDWQAKHNVASHDVPILSKKGASQKDSPETESTRYIFVPLQVNTDSQIVLFSPWVDNMEHLIRVLSAAASALGDQIPKIIIKTHPACDTDYSQLAAQLPSKRIELITSGDTPSLIANATGVVTINSTVGIEAILAGIPTLVLGQAFYAIEGLTLSAQDETTLASGLVELSSFTADEKLRAGWLHYLRHEYQVSGGWRKADDSHLAAMTDKIIQTVTSS
ncbi:MAG: hypothetical protein P1U57_08825, partial [Oleibacter sp.]|nr:hypothetical protein [Thalassolituus sp.]